MNITQELANIFNGMSTGMQNDSIDKYVFDVTNGIKFSRRDELFYQILSHKWSYEGLDGDNMVEISKNLLPELIIEFKSLK